MLHFLSVETQTIKKIYAHDSSCSLLGDFERRLETAHGRPTAQQANALSYFAAATKRRARPRPSIHPAELCSKCVQYAMGNVNQNDQTQYRQDHEQDKRDQDLNDRGESFPFHLLPSSRRRSDRREVKNRLKLTPAA
jgi:hypothetical protein